MHEESTIFVAVASYRDHELRFTVEDVLSKASDPSKVTIGICVQDDVVPDVLQHTNRIRIDHVHHEQSKGVCWARNRIGKLYANEDFLLQIDSHMRFVQNWDVKLKTLYGQIGRKRAIISTYPPPYAGTAYDVKLSSALPQKLVANRFESNGSLSLRQVCFHPFDGYDSPLPGRFVAAGFLFTIGTFVEEVPYDPEIYFQGEEITLSIRAFTHGYRFFHPNTNICWHSYERRGASRHWDDFDNWTDYERRSSQRLHEILIDGVHDRFGLGQAHCKQEYEAYSGISFNHRRIHRSCLIGSPPPSAYDTKWVATSEHQYKGWVEIKLPKPNSRATYKFVYFGIHDQGGNELIRIDLVEEAILSRIITRIDVEFFSLNKPAFYTIWPFLLDENKWVEAKFTEELTERNSNISITS